MQSHSKQKACVSCFLVDWNERQSSSNSIILGVNHSLLGHEDTVEELALILAPNTAHASKLSATEGEGSVVDSVKNELVLHVLREGNRGATQHFHSEILLSTEEVLHSDFGAVFRDSNVDGEMSVYQSHLVAEALVLSAKDTRLVNLIIYPNNSQTRQ